MRFKITQRLIESYMDNDLISNFALKIGIKDKLLAELYKSKNGRVDGRSLFDMASVTKILSVTALSLIAYDRGLIDINDNLSRFYDYNGPLTVKNLLTHTMGIGHKNLCAEGVSYDNVGEHILSIAPDIPVGSDTRYSCPAFILMGKILEKVYGKRLDILFKELVATPLNMSLSGYLPDTDCDIVNSNVENEERGLVNDYNCRYLGGVAGNAGIFACMDDLTSFAQMLLQKGRPLFSEKTWDTATQNHTPDMSRSRGLGFVYVDEKYKQTGELFSQGSIGHGGHTGQSLFVEPQSGLYVICLTDATVSTVRKYGHKEYAEVLAMRENIHNAIKEDLNLCQI